MSHEDVVMANPEEILAFWLDEIGPQGWYVGSDDLDQTIRVTVQPL